MKYTYSMLIAVLVLFTVIAPAHADSDDLEFEAELSGAEEVPNPVETETSGEVEFEVNDDLTEIKFELEIEDGKGIFGANGAHIHCATVGANGPVVVVLAPADPPGLDGDIEITGTITGDDIVNIACGTTIAELVQSMKNGNTYVNVHSAANPGGEVRGQIEED